MTRSYKCLNEQVFASGQYTLLPIRSEDMYPIMNWRNDQIAVLRQKAPLTQQQQEQYFSDVVSKLFAVDRPPQLLFSLLEGNVLIGYGGLVHIDWESSNAEVSFLTATERANVPERFIADWRMYLHLLKKIAFQQLEFMKIYTFAYDIRPALYPALDQSGFIEEARLKNHVRIGQSLHDVLIHSCFANSISLRMAEPGDLMLYFDWTNDEEVRRNSFNQSKIPLESHKKWFAAKLASPGTFMFVGHTGKTNVGQIRFDEIEPNQYEIAFSIDRLHRGKGIGSELIKFGTAKLLHIKPDARRVIGKVKAENQASRKAFLKAGFKLLNENSSGVDIFYRDNPRHS